MTTPFRQDGPTTVATCCSQFRSTTPLGSQNNVCARPDLTLAGGAMPGNNQGIQQHAGRSWLQLSYHIDPNDWRPHSDAAKGSNLTDYLTGALSRFQEAS